MKNQWTPEEKARAIHLGKLMQRECGGDRAALAEAIGVGEKAVQRFLRVGSDRPMGYKKAREIEALFHLPTESMDTINTQNSEVYYVAIHTNALHTHKIILLLQDEEQVLECSVVFGDFDILLKVETDDVYYMDRLLSRLARIPGIRNCRTYRTAKHLRWQKAQEANFEFRDKDNTHIFRNGVDRFLDERISRLFDAVKEVENGDFFVRDNDDYPLESKRILEGIEKTILSTTTIGEKIPFSKEFIEKEKELIEKNGLRSKRMIFLTKNDLKGDSFYALQKEYKKHIRTGCEVRFIFTHQWYKGGQNAATESFLIADQEFICFRHEDQEMTSFKKDAEVISRYIDIFTSNWGRASKSMEDINDMYGEY